MLMIVPYKKNSMVFLTFMEYCNSMIQNLSSSGKNPLNCLCKVLIFHVFQSEKSSKFCLLCFFLLCRIMGLPHQPECNSLNLKYPQLQYIFQMLELQIEALFWKILETLGSESLATSITAGDKRNGEISWNTTDF